MEEQVVNADNGYIAMRPTDPTLEGKQFEGWYTSEGEQYSFEDIVSKSITLYAKWNETDYVSSVIEPDYTPYVAVASGALFIILSAVGCVMVIRRRRKDDFKKSL